RVPFGLRVRRVVTISIPKSRFQRIPQCFPESYQQQVTRWGVYPADAFCQQEAVYQRAQAALQVGRFGLLLSKRKMVEVHYLSVGRGPPQAQKTRLKEHIVVPRVMLNHMHPAVRALLYRDGLLPALALRPCPIEAPRKCRGLLVGELDGVILTERPPDLLKV